MENRTCSALFLLGLYLGGYTNTVANLAIAGLVGYISYPEYFTRERLEYYGRVSYTILDTLVINRFRFAIDENKPKYTKKSNSKKT